jgi:adenylyltransferase/sulfurtransferase
VVGAGAIGNEVIKNLALLGVGNLLILDMDRIETTNLSRTVLFKTTDVGASKAQVAAHAAQQLNPSIQVTLLEGDLRFVLGLGRLHQCSLALGCLDNQGARSFLNRMCIAAQVPYLDAAMWAMGGEVRAFLSPEQACFDCTLSPAERTQLWLRYSCSGGLQPVAEDTLEPTTITTTAIIGGLLCQEAVRLLCGERLESGSALVYNGLSGKLSRTTFRRDPQCPHHTPLDWASMRPISTPVSLLTAQELLVLAQPDLDGPPTLDLGRDLLLAFVCPTCGQREERGQLARLVAEAEAICPTCGAERRSELLSSITLDAPQAAWTLAQLGVPAGEVLSVRGYETVVSFWLTESSDE